MKILIIYHLPNKSDRLTIYEHLFSFKNYSDEQCYYLNTAFGVPGYITRTSFDLIIYHYTFLGHIRWGRGSKPFNFDRIKLLRELKGYKVAMPQDEYVKSIVLNKFFKEYGIKTIYTLCPQSEWEKVYPKDESGLEDYFYTFAGYIDEIALENIQNFVIKHGERHFDIGYRARKNPYWLGSHGLLKWQITDRFIEATKNTSLKVNLSNNSRHVFYGNDWYKFLCNCRVILGCEGGSSLLDPDGKLGEIIDKYCFEKSTATFEEVEEKCFQGLDGNLKLFALSPRHFEACMTKTCQALVEGEYGGILKPGIHYIEIKKDWSNLKEVINSIKDVAFCERIAENAYKDIVESGLYTYKYFVNSVLEHVRDVSPVQHDTKAYDFYCKLLLYRESCPFLFSPITYLKENIKYTIYRTLLFLNIPHRYIYIVRKIRDYIGL